MSYSIESAGVGHTKRTKEKICSNEVTMHVYGIAIFKGWFHLQVPEFCKSLQVGFSDDNVPVRDKPSRLDSRSSVKVEGVCPLLLKRNLVLSDITWDVYGEDWGERKIRCDRDHVGE